MEYVYIVLIVALLEYEIFAFIAGQGRNAYNVNAPAMVGHPDFERMLRVQQNTAEHLIALIPAMIIFGIYVSPYWAAGLGMLFVLSRLEYMRAYRKDPNTRARGFLLGIAAIAALVFGALIGLAIKVF